MAAQGALVGSMGLIGAGSGKNYPVKPTCILLAHLPNKSKLDLSFLKKEMFFSNLVLVEKLHFC